MFTPRLCDYRRAAPDYGSKMGRSGDEVQLSDLSPADGNFPGDQCSVRTGVQRAGVRRGGGLVVMWGDRFVPEAGSRERQQHHHNARISAHQRKTLGQGGRTTNRVDSTRHSTARWAFQYGRPAPRPDQAASYISNYEAIKRIT
jgi:hypothetical protein